ncbi:MAG: diguanylate cyclase [Roseburia sp.]|jgi:diguanylate cyclase (GGDEF)-like protein|nr:diguanylate cyclase [Roseburia sp.]
MDTLTHLSIDLFPAVVLGIIWLDNEKKMTRTADKWLLAILALLSFGQMSVNMIISGLTDTELLTGGPVMWILVVLQALIIAAVSQTWLLFVCNRLFTGGYRRVRKIVFQISAGVCAVFFVLTVTTPWTGLICRESGTGGCERGPAWWLPWLVSVTLIAGSMAVAVYLRRREVLRDHRAEENQFFWLGLGIAVGITAESWWQSWWFAAPSVSLAMLWLYLNRQNHQITTDGLTGLSNRRKFDQELHRRAEQPAGKHWGMLMIDIDEFKWINDNLGHVVGDEALKETAGILRRTFGRERAFLARYGGDEFVVIDNFRNGREAEGVKKRIERELARFNGETKREYRISLSIGYALWSEVARERPEQLVDLADERMYEEKQKKKAAAERS